MRKNQKALYKMILTAIFSALCFVGVNIRIPLPVGFVHLGNFVCIMAALLCGGLVGGLSGSIGMGLFDLYYYGGFTAGVLRTILLKLGMGLIAGFVFHILLKKNKRIKLLSFILLGVFVVGLIVSSIFCGIGGFDFFGNHIEIHYTIPVLLSIIVLMYLCILIFDKKLNHISKAAMIATSFAIIFNLFGEIYIKALLYYWMESKYATFEQAYIYSMSGIVSAAITSILTCILSGIIFYPLYSSVKIFIKSNEKIA